MEEPYIPQCDSCYVIMAHMCPNPNPREDGMMPPGKELGIPLSPPASRTTGPFLPDMALLPLGIPPLPSGQGPPANPQAPARDAKRPPLHRVPLPLLPSSQKSPAPSPGVGAHWMQGESIHVPGLGSPAASHQIGEPS